MKRANSRAAPEYSVGLVEAHQHALFVFRTEGQERWQGATLSVSPDVLYDITGMPLVFQFHVQKELMPIGVIRISADKRLGSPVLSVQYGPVHLPDFAALIAELTAPAQAACPAHRVVQAYPVVYSYPKTGVQFLLAPEDERENSPNTAYVIFDAETRLIVEELPEGAGDSATIDGQAAYSLLGHAEARAATRAWAGLKPQQLRHRILERWQDRSQQIAALLAAWSDIEGGSEEIPTGIEEHLLPARFGIPEGTFPAYGQIDTYHCAIASAQMIIQYLTGVRIDQRDLEKPFGKGPFGTSNTAQMQGYRTMLGGDAFAPSPLDETPSPDEVAGVIDAGLPMKSGVPQHARACCGYRRLLFRAPDGTTAFDAFELRIHDPWPPKEGKLLWESWNSIVHTNFIYMTRKGEIKQLKGD